MMRRTRRRALRRGARAYLSGTEWWRRIVALYKSQIGIHMYPVLASLSYNMSVLMLGICGLRNV